MEDTTVQDPPPAPPPSPYGPPPPRRLLRREDGEDKIGGVCAGIADYLGVDVTFVRIAAVVLAFAGPGVPAYLVGWAVIPKAPDGTPPNPVRHGPILEGGTNPVVGVALLLAAALVVFDGGLFDEGVLVPALLIGGGVWLLVRDRDATSPPPASTVPPAWPTPPAPPAAPATAWPATGVTAPVQGGQDAPCSPVAPTDPAVARQPRPWESSGTASAPVAPRPAKEPGSPLGRLTLGSLALVGALVWSLTAADVVSPDAADVLALALVGLGVALVVGARYGRARWLIIPGLVLVAALTAVSALDVPLRGGFGERRHEPFVAADLEEPFRLTAGEMVIDLRSLDLGAARRTVTASIGAGSLRVVVPEGATVLLRGDVGAGELVYPGSDRRRATDGLGIDERRTLRGVEGAGTIELDLRVGLGEVVVTRG